MTAKEIYESIDLTKLPKATADKLRSLETKTKGFTIKSDKIEAALKQTYNTLKERKPEALKNLKVEMKTVEQKIETKAGEKTAKVKIPKVKGTKKVAKKTPTPSAPKKRRTVATLAKEIRKAGESWQDALARAGKEMKAETKAAEAATKKELDKLRDMLKSDPAFAGYPRTYGKQKGDIDVSKDAKTKALPAGKRVSKKGVKNQYGTSKGGRTYWENRDNRSDRLAPNYPTKVYLEYGGSLATQPYWLANNPDALVSTETMGEMFEVGGEVFVPTEQLADNPNALVSTTTYAELFEKGGRLDITDMFEKGGFVAMYNGKKLNIDADSLYEAKKKAIEELRIPKSKQGLLSVMSNKSMANQDFRFFEKGGKIGFEGLAKKVAKNYEGKKVDEKYQAEYGKTYSKDEAMEVGRKIAAKVYRGQQAKMAMGGSLEGHGLRKGDVILQESGYLIKVLDESGKPMYVNLADGYRGAEEPLPFKKGGRLNELAEGIAHELEHTSDLKVAAKIAIDHLKETPDYYTRLKKAMLKKGGEVILKDGDKGKKFDADKYPSILKDFDGDGIPNIDDKRPLVADQYTSLEDADTVEQVQFAKVFRKLLDEKAKMQPKMYNLVGKLKGDVPSGSTIYFRTKTPYSIMNKLVDKRMTDPKKGLTDMIGTMVVVEDRKELDALNKRIKAGEFGEIIDSDDYYKTPKGGYRAYHYIIMTDGSPAELQIKTKRQKLLNESSHEPYKQKELNSKRLGELSLLADKADRGIKKAIKEFDEITKDPKALTKELTLKK